MAKKSKKASVLDFLDRLPLWSRRQDRDDGNAFEEERLELDRVKSRLLDILSHEALINTGRVQIIGLQHLKERLGDRWDSHRKSIHTSLQSMLRRRLHASDVFFQHDDDDYVIVFASLGYDAAKLVCAGVMQELNTMLLGSEDSRSISVRTAVGVVEGRLLLEENSIDDVLKELDEVNSECELDWDSDEDEEGGANIDEAVDGVSGDMPIGWTPLDLSEERKQTRTLQSWAPINEDALDEGVVPEQFELIYRPVWSPAQEIISSYVTNFVGIDEIGQLRNAYSFARGGKLIRAMDRSVLKRATELGIALIEHGQRFILSIPHHYESAINWSRLSEYTEQCKAVPKEIQNYLILTCDHFPPGVPASKLLTIGYALKPHCRGLAVNIDWATRDLSPYTDAGFGIVGLFVPEDMPMMAIKRRIEEFAESARRCGAKTAVLNVHDVGLCEIVRNAGVDFVMGRLIGDYQKAPSHLVKLPWSEILSRQRFAV